jgi:hypothetical protein
MPRFSVTFERYFPHADDEDVCGPDEEGFVLEDASLRDALNECADRADWARASACDEYPIRAPRWFNFDDWNNGTREYFEKGITEQRALHVPDSVTPASRRRLARFLGLKVAQ